MSELDFENPHYCPVYDKVIDIDLCYETLMCLNCFFKISTKNLKFQLTRSAESVMVSHFRQI